MGSGHVRVAPQALQLVALHPGRAASGLEQTINRLDAHLHRIALVGAPERQGFTAGVFMTLAMFGVVAPGFLQEGTGSRHLVRRLGQAHQGRRRRTDIDAGVGPHAVAGFFLEGLEHALGNAQADSREAAGEVRTIRAVEDLAVRVQTEAGGLALHHVLGFLNAVLGDEDIVDGQGFGAAAFHAHGIPVIQDCVVAARQHREAVILRAFGIQAAAADNRPLGMIAAAAPTHLAAEHHAALDLLDLAEWRNRAAGRGVRVGTPDFILQLSGEHRQLMAVGAQQAHGPGGTGAGTGEQGDAIAEIRQGHFHAAIGFGQERAVQADALEHRDVLGRDHPVLFGLGGVGGDDRENLLECFKERGWLFHC
ncbi:hypothetical protein D3C80_847280 [compost metagenome]